MKIIHISPLMYHPVFSPLIEKQSRWNNVWFVKLDLENNVSENNYIIKENIWEKQINLSNIKRIYDQSSDLSCISY